MVAGRPAAQKNRGERGRPDSYEEIIARDKASLDIFGLRDESLEGSANLPEPHIIAEESWRIWAPLWKRSRTFSVICKSAP